MHFSTDAPRRAEIRRQSFLRLTRQLQQGSQRYFLGRESQIVTGCSFERPKTSPQTQHSSVNRRLARQIFENAVGRAIAPSAFSGQPHTAAHDVVAPKLVNAYLAAQQKRLRCTGEICFEIYATPPSSIAAAEQLRDLPQLAVLPLQRDYQRSISQAGSALPCCIELNQSRVRQVEVGAHGLGLHARAPGILAVLPQRSVCFR